MHGQQNIKIRNAMFLLQIRSWANSREGKLFKRILYHVRHIS